MAQPKKGDRVRVTLEGDVTGVIEDWLEVRYGFRDGFSHASITPATCAVEVIEPAYEEGAIYESVTGGKFLYSPQADAKKPWVFIYFDGYLGGSEIGDRFNRIMGARKLAPVE